MRFGNSIGTVIDRHEHAPDWFDFVELQVGQRKLPVEDIDRDRLASTLADRGFDLVVHLPFVQPLTNTVDSLHDAHLYYLDGVLQAAGEMGAEAAVAHATALPTPNDDERARLPDAIDDLTVLGDAHGVEVCLENVGQLRQGFALDTLGEAVADAGGRLAFDVGHAFEEAGNDGIDDFLGSYADLVSHLHVHDVRRRGDSHLSLGEGDVDWERVADGLSGYDGRVTMEIFADDRTYIEHSAERFREAFDTETEP